MRRILKFRCAEQALAATLDEAPGETGLLIVSGGNEIRIGAHRGMAMLARDIAAAGHPAFRFDRRGIGDSEGENGGFLTSAPDLAAAVAAFRTVCPQLRRIVGFGNCDAASALALFGAGPCSALVLANPWVIEPQDDLPGEAAIRARYAERLRDPKAWIGLFTGATDLRKLVRGLARIARPSQPASLSRDVAAGLAAFPGPVTILLAARDNTALGFADAWQGEAFKDVRARADVTITRLDSGSHSFAGKEDQAALTAALLKALS